MPSEWRCLWSFAGVIKPDEYPFNQETRRLWVTSYLDRKCELSGQQKVPDVVVEKILLEIEIFNIVRPVWLKQLNFNDTFIAKPLPARARFFLLSIGLKGEQIST